MNSCASLTRLRNVCFVLLALVLMAAFSSAASYQKIYSFTDVPDGRDPATRLTFDAAGNLYGTTAAGGEFDLGSVFRIAPDGTETILYSFSGGPDGSDPHGGVTIGSDGSLYGTAVAGGSGGSCAGDGCGVIYKLTLINGVWIESTLYSFRGGSDGFGPGTGLIFDAAGNLYGTAPDGGKHGAGVVFELSPVNGRWHFKVIHAFTGGKDGAVGSLGRLLVDSSGNLYGTAELGGANGLGTVYKLSPTLRGVWRETTLYTFQGIPDGANPFGGLIFDAAGNLYGTTYFGGNVGMGTVFQLSPGPNGGWQENVLNNFQGGTDGSFPTSTLLFNASGILFGTTSTGGRPSCDCGTIFKLSLASGSWHERIVHFFGKGTDGYSPNYELTPDGNGNLFGATPAGGNQRIGMIYKLTP